MNAEKWMLDFEDIKLMHSFLFFLFFLLFATNLQMVPD
jgi:hypothetical protein